VNGPAWLPAGRTTHVPEDAAASAVRADAASLADVVVEHEMPRPGGTVPETLDVLLQAVNARAARAAAEAAPKTKEDTVMAGTSYASMVALLP
jgi:hypothetical protein